jgi:phospholipid/cholesterol/gamma-HCH transport system substrate-binding protein
MDMTFSGFPIGRVQRIALGPDGKAHIVVEISAKDAHWLRISSIFTLVRSVVGGTNLRAYSGMPTDPPLPDNAERSVLQGDVGAELPKVIASTRELLDNLAALTGRVNEPTGTLDKANQLLAQANTLASNADTQVFGKQGVLPETRAAVVQLKSLLMEARTSLQKVDLVLHNAQKVSADAATITENAAKASVDLGALRADVDASLRNVQGLVDDINRKWPFARDREITLP